ncbi:MAG: DUF3784 domain-containing protein [Lachnospiraceae bacterium]|nr:DUF3784 domain-containing protein [Lachnospiraceae bacterium]
MIISIVIFVTAALILCLGIRSFMGKGRLLNNAYLYASDKERETMDKKPYYIQSGVVFCCLSLIFLIVGLATLMESDKILLLEILVVIGMIIYVIVSTAIINKKKNKTRV